MKYPLQPPASPGQPYSTHEKFSPVPPKTSLVKFVGSSNLSYESYDHTVRLDPAGEVLLDPGGEVTAEAPIDGTILPPARVIFDGM